VVTDMMRAVAYKRNLPVDDPDSLIDVELAVREPEPHDLLVRVSAVSVNPVDVKQRSSSDPGGTPRVLGFDAAGVVTATGADVTLFEVGDEVFYAGSIARPGSNAEYQLVDERITGHKPTTLDFAEAAALPLTSITAWETLFDRFKVDADSPGTLVVMAGAGGVGSMLIQLACRLTALTVIATASRAESQRWARDLGAHHVIDHHAGLAEKVLAVAPDGVDYVFTPYSTGNIEAFAQMLRPQGQVTAIDSPLGLDLLALKAKSITWHWESMFTRPLFLPADPTQHHALEQIRGLVDDGLIRTTMTTRLEPINAENLRRAHTMIESGTTIGKVVVDGF
jgi:zinc-binding alcohol dehydrogenase family protein